MVILNKDYIKDKDILLIHKHFSELRKDLTSFFNDNNESRILFNFNKIKIDNTVYLFKIKFITSHKTIKFIIDETTDFITIQLLERTDNIVEDISDIYRVLSVESIPKADSYMDKCSELFYWGLKIEEDKKGAYHRAPARKIEPGITMDRDKIYYGIIRDVDKKEDAGNWIMEITLENGMIYSMPYVNNYVEYIKPGKLFLLNYKNDWNVLKFNVAKHHLEFTPVDYSTLYATYGIKNSYIVNKGKETNRILR